MAKNLVISLMSALMFISPQTGGKTGKTVWDGAYTTEQASRGQTAYLQRCASCHGEDFRGVAGTNAAVLIGQDFVDNWREDDLGSFFRFLQTSMPSRAATRAVRGGRCTGSLAGRR